LKHGGVCVIIALIALVGCDSQRRTAATTVLTSEDEIDVIVSFLQTEYVSKIPAATPLVIRDTLTVADIQNRQSPEKFAQSLLSEASDRVPKDLIKDFCGKNTKPQPVWPELSSRLQVILLSQGEEDSIFAPRPTRKPDGWDIFYAKYPKSPGIIILSRVGFNRRGDLAAVYVRNQIEFLAGSGRIHVFRKQDGQWVELPVHFGPQWRS